MRDAAWHKRPRTLDPPLASIAGRTTRTTIHRYRYLYIHMIYRSAIFNFQRTWLQKFDGVPRTIGLPFCQGGTVSACSGNRFVGGPIRTPGKKGSTILLTSSRAIGDSFVAPESPMADFCSDEKFEANAIWRWARTCGYVEGMRPKGKRVTNIGGTVGLQPCAKISSQHARSG